MVAIRTHCAKRSCAHIFAISYLIKGTNPSQLNPHYHVELRFVATVASISPRRAEFTTPTTNQDYHR
ncbi:hypothetical protein COCHEDRAFT_1023283, partial [Bipolaris maydis C5]